MRLRKGLSVWAIWSVVLVSAHLCRWAVRNKPPSADAVIRDLVSAALFVWVSTLPRDAWGVAFLAWAASAVLALIAYVRVERVVHLAPFQDAVATYTGEFLPLLIAAGAVMLWLRRTGTEHG